ncbi:YncE family protein [Flavobacterium sp. ANB]|uniref:YncE family protein n=1 Tax=unclassified Flavobacterium TaxID=196869 RepID=UPI0012B893D7|nr:MULTISPECIES: YncE family protein [unclassified Flavobacterium]MBF4518955.1 YncE family protein [Flavobacterium sp. ANB]MTD71565.1 YncE family protein [Flavobacterium sp. LC2016-13]
MKDTTGIPIKNRIKIKLFCQTIIAFCFCLNGCNSQTTTQNQSLQFVASIPLPKISGRMDHLAYDSKHHLIFVAALGNNTVEVIDFVAKKVIHTIKDLDEPQGIVYIPESNSIFIANGGDGQCDVFNEDTFKKTASIKLSGDADNVRYDAADKKIYVGYGNGGIAIIDANTFKLISEINFSGHPESFQIDKSAKKIYINVPDEQQIVVIDLEKKLVSDKWKLTQAKSNFPMSLDQTNHRLFIGCRHPAKLLVFDTQTGKSISSFDIDSDVDDIFYDSRTKKSYLSCGNGHIDVFEQTNPNTYKENAKITTHWGARTSLFIAELNQLVIASPSNFNNDASLLIYDLK